MLMGSFRFRSRRSRLRTTTGEEPGERVPRRARWLRATAIAGLLVFAGTSAVALVLHKRLGDARDELEANAREQLPMRLRLAQTESGLATATRAVESLELDLKEKERDLSKAREELKGLRNDIQQSQAGDLNRMMTCNTAIEAAWTHIDALWALADAAADYGVNCPSEEAFPGSAVCSGIGGPRLADAENYAESTLADFEGAARECEAAFVLGD